MSNSPPPDERQGLRFDPTINAGHVLTFVGLLLAGLAAWGLMDKRVTVLEQGQAYQRERDTGQDIASSAKFGEVRETMREVRDQLKELARDQRERDQREREKAKR